MYDTTRNHGKSGVLHRMIQALKKIKNGKAKYNKRKKKNQNVERRVMLIV